MQFHIITNKLEIKFELHEEVKALPAILLPEVLWELDSYPPHHVEVMLENDLTVKRASVDWYCPWDKSERHWTNID